jgi:UDP-glucose:(heptosyl)LPS alpha-1,3-glucosyltransferase
LAHKETLTPAKRLLGGGRVKHRLALAIEKRALAPGAVRRVIVNAEMVRRDLLARYPLEPARVRVISNGVDLEHFNPGRRAGEGAALRRELGIAPEAPLVLFLGTGYGRKGLGALLEAFPAVLAAEPRARLAVVGYDSAAARYAALAGRLGIDGATHFLGGRGDPEVCYAAADVFALPTRYDPFANATLEALASGLPVLTTAANGGSELLVESCAGLVREPDPRALAEGLVALLQGDRAAQREAARALAERHSIESKLEATSAVLAEAAAERAATTERVP